jgi:glycolate oxidase FAD binding subunit
VDTVNEFVSTCAEAIRSAAASGRKLSLRGGGTKAFYGRPDPEGELVALDLRSNDGIVDYEPTELVVTARGGTPLALLQAALAERGQMLAFEAPSFGEAATVGGMVASGLSGPRRSACGALRDFVLGASILDGRGEVLRFGGRVMKNVAGYDVSRLMAGSMGTLGILLDVSLKTQPVPASEETLRFEMPESKAIEWLNRWAGQPLPISASSWLAGELHLRLSGAVAAVVAAREKLGGGRLSEVEANRHWASLREQQLEFFTEIEPSSRALWRLSLPSTAPAEALDRIAGERLLEWGGALRWLVSGAEAALVREVAARAGGHATLFRASPDRRSRDGVFQPLPSAALAIHQRLKATFDPQGLFNPGRMYAEV